MGTLTGCDDFQLNKMGEELTAEDLIQKIEEFRGISMTWKKTQPVTAKGMDERVVLTAEDLIQKMEDGVEVTYEVYRRHLDVLSDEYWKALFEGDTVRADKLDDKRWKLLEVYRHTRRQRKEQEQKIRAEAEKIKAEAEVLSQKPDIDPQVLEAAEFVNSMTKEVLEQKEKLQQKNREMEKISSMKEKQTVDTPQVKETCRDVQIYLRQITTLVREMILTLPEEVKTKLESLLSAFQRLVAGMWKLLFLVLLLHELEKLLVSLKHEGGYISTKKRRLKYGFEFAAMMALWLSHDVESNPGPPYDKRGCMEWLLRQLSEALKQQLPVKGSLWSTIVADAAYAAGFPRKFYWNNPSGKNKLGNKDSMDTLVQKAKELGHMLTSMNCLPPELAPLLQDLSSEKGKERLVVHCKIENLQTAVDALLNVTLSPSQKKRVYQLVRKISKKSKRIQHHSSTSMTSGSEFGQLADNCSNTGNAKCNLETDVLAENLLSLMEAKKSQTPMLMVQQPLDIQEQQTEQEQALDINTIANFGTTGEIDNQFVTLVLQHAADPSSSDECSSGDVAAWDEVPNVDLIDEILSGLDAIPYPRITSTTVDSPTASSALDQSCGHLTNETIPSAMTDAPDTENEDGQISETQNLATNGKNVSSPGDVSMSFQEPTKERNSAASDSCQHIISTEEEREHQTESMIEEIPGNKSDQDSHEGDRLVGNTDQHTGSDNNGQGYKGTVDEEGGACQTPAPVNDSDIIQARLLDKLIQHFDPVLKNHINKLLPELQAQSALSKFQATTHIQDVTKKDDTRHIQSAEEMNGEVLDDSTEGPVDYSAPISGMGDEDATANSMRICEEDLERVYCTDDSVTSGKPSDTDTREDPPDESYHDDLAASTTTRNRKRKKINRKQPAKRRRE